MFLVLLAGGVFWYTTRPQPVKPWNQEALKSEYYRLDISDPPDGIDCATKKCFKFLYNVTNKTDTDYKLSSETGLTMMTKLEDSKSLTSSKGDLHLATPAFIPSKQTVRVELIFPSYGFDKPEPSYDDDKARIEFRKAMETFVRTKLPNLDGFVVFDEGNRYQIEFAAGWKTDEKESKK